MIRKKDLFEKIEKLEKDIIDIRHTLYSTGYFNVYGEMYEDKNFTQDMAKIGLLMDYFKLEVKEIPGKVILSKKKKK